MYGTTQNNFLRVRAEEHMLFAAFTAWKTIAYGCPLFFISAIDYNPQIVGILQTVQRIDSEPAEGPGDDGSMEK